jgi:superoxide dismutase, Fe-Mn family
MSNRITNRRDFLKSTGKAGIAAGLSFSALSSFTTREANDAFTFPLAQTPYEQTPLPYAYNALEPVIDGATMELHYSKHAASYAKSLAEAVAAENVNKQSTSLENLLAQISKYSSKMRNNAGGHYNHELFWKLMKPGTEAGKPSGKLLTAIEKDFNSFEAFKNQFGEAAKNRFGSGWAWLIAGKDKKLTIASTPNQDNPLMDVSEAKGFPLLGLDVWEHAYYLKYQNKRPEYISAWWNVVNWKFVEERFAAM